MTDEETKSSFGLSYRQKAAATVSVAKEIKQESSGVSPVLDVASLEYQKSLIALDDKVQDMWIKKVYAGVFCFMMTLQLIFTNVLFCLYASKGVDWKIPTSALGLWLNATVVQTIGIVYVIIRHLFPRRDEKIMSLARLFAC